MAQVKEPAVEGRAEKEMAPSEKLREDPRAAMELAEASTGDSRTEKLGVEDEMAESE